jgi:hypothetical protein
LLDIVGDLYWARIGASICAVPFFEVGHSVRRFPGVSSSIVDVLVLKTIVKAIDWLMKLVVGQYVAMLFLSSAWHVQLKFGSDQYIRKTLDCSVLASPVPEPIVTARLDPLLRTSDTLLTGSAARVQLVAILLIRMGSWLQIFRRYHTLLQRWLAEVHDLLIRMCRSQNSYCSPPKA